MADQQVVNPALSLLAVSMGVQVFESLTPPIAEVRKRTPQSDPAFAADVRVGEVSAAVITIGVGVIASALARSSVPLWIALLVTAMMMLVYECTLRRYRPLEVASGKGS